MSPKRKYIYR